LLQGKLTRLRSIEAKDIDCYLGWINQPELARLITGSIMPTSRPYMVKALETPMGFPGQNLFFAIELLSEEKLIGFCFLKNFHPVHRFVELEQFFIGEKKFRQNGHGRDAMDVVLDYSFTELNLNRLWLLIYLYNQGAVRFYEKCGFLKEGVLRQVQFSMGEYHDGLIMGILKKDWLAKIQH
jgi:RimJ/RimL family protein N-acetyltransferase